MQLYTPFVTSTSSEMPFKLKQMSRQEGGEEKGNFLWSMSICRLINTLIPFESVHVPVFPLRYPLCNQW